MRRPALVGLLVLTSLAVAAVPAQADTVNSTCNDLQTKLSGATEDRIINMTEAVCHDSAYDVPGDFALTINGLGTDGTSFENDDGGAPLDDAFEDTGAGTKGLTFSNVEIDAFHGQPAISFLNGRPLTIVNSLITTDDTGTAGVLASGPLTVTGSTFSGDSGTLLRLDSGSPGARTIRVSGNVFADNADTGAEIDVHPGDDAVISGNLFQENVHGLRVSFQDPATPSTATVSGNDFIGNDSSDGAAGLLVQGVFSATITDTLISRDNLFQGNGVSTPGSNQNLFGGAAFYVLVNVDSRNDAFIGNSLPNPVGLGDEAEGGGFAFRGCGAGVPVPKYHAENLLLLGNSVASEGEGGGFYVGCPEGPARAELFNSTVSANTAPAGGGSGISGEDDDKILLRNTIVAGNHGSGDLAGFNGAGGRDILSSDVCPLVAGAGNVCAAPALTAGGDETAASPTVDKGSNAFVPIGLTKDAFGDARILGGTVDIGAAERTPAGAGPAPDRVPPVISRPSISRKTFRVGSKATPVSARKKRAPVGTTFSYTLSEAATVSLKIERKLPGRKVKKGKGKKAKTRCVAETRKNKKGHRKCSLFKRAGTLIRKSKVGTTKVAFSGRIGTKKLKPGSYRVTISAKDAAGNTATAKKTLTFKIVK